VLGWEPEISLEQGLTHTYGWIESQVQKKAIALYSESDGDSRGLREEITIPHRKV